MATLSIYAADVRVGDQITAGLPDGGTITVTSVQIAQGGPGLLVLIGHAAGSRMVAAALQLTVTRDGATVPDVPYDPFPLYLTEAEARAALVPFWAPGETVAAGAVRMTSLGITITRNAPGTTGSSYDATEAAKWTVVSGSGGGGGSSYNPLLQNTADSALARAYAGFASRSAKPIVIVANGSSIAADAANHGIFGQIISGLQRRFPKYDGGLGANPNIVMYSGDDTYTPTANGLQIVNFSTGGSTAANQWTRLAGAKAKAASLNPPLHLWVIGINDSYAGNGTTPLVDPVAYRAALKADIDYFLANQAIKPCIGLIHGYQRPDNNVPSTWEAYGDACRSLAAEYPEFVVAIDTSPAFIRAEVPGNNPYGLVGSDNLHPDVPGKTMLADIVLGALDVRVPLSAPASTFPLGISHTVAPAITGDPTVGQVLTVSAGSFYPTTGLTRAYQWLRDGAAISGATATTYTAVAGDVGKVLTVRVTVTVTDSRYRTTAYVTAGVTVTGGATPTMANTVAPTITGTPAVGQTLTANPGTWNPNDGTYAYQWLRNGTAISGATSQTYTLVSADAGANIAVRVTASKSGYSSASATSAAVAVPGGSAGTVWASDGFSTPSAAAVDMHNRSTDAAFGGTARTWTMEFGTSNVWLAQDGVLKGGTAQSGSNLYLTDAPAEVDIEYKFLAGVAGSPGNFGIRFAVPTSGSAGIVSRYIVGGVHRFEANDGTTSTQGSNVTYTPAVGDVVVLSKKGTTVKLLVNGTQKDIFTVPALTTGRLYLFKDFNSTVQLDYIKITDTTGV